MLRCERYSACLQLGKKNRGRLTSYVYSITSSSTLSECSVSVDFMDIIEINDHAGHSFYSFTATPDGNKLQLAKIIIIIIVIII